MQIPIFSHGNVLLKTKICQEPNCGKEFIGRYNRKYCDFHMTFKHRIRRRRYKYEVPIDLNNRIIKHNFNTTVNVVLNCMLCNKEFLVKLFPRQRVYPKYCEKHVNAYQRIIYENNKMSYMSQIG